MVALNDELLTGEITGYKWEDLDGDGIWDQDESGLAGWTIYLDQNKNNQLDEGEISTVSDETGKYRFTNLQAGSYTVAEVFKPDWVQSYPANLDDTIAQVLNESLQLSGNKLVWWQSVRRGNPGNYIFDREIYFFNGINIIELTDSTIQDNNLKISGNHVVWSGFNGINNQLYLYNGNRVIQLTDSTVNNTTSDYQIQGSHVVWSESDGNDREIYLYNGNSVIQLTNNTTDDYSPQVFGNRVVWSGYDGNDREIYLYDGSSITKLTDNTVDDLDPKISSNSVLWESGGRYYLYNGKTTIQLQSDSQYDSQAQLSGNHVIWLGTTEYPEYSIPSIYYYDGNSVIKLIEGDYSTPPSISGNKATWVHDSGSQIYYYDGSQVTLVPNNSSDFYSSSIKINDNYVIWWGTDIDYDFNFNYKINAFNTGNTVNLKPGEVITGKVREHESHRDLSGG